MKVEKQFNLMSVTEYLYHIDNYKQYTNFNTLGVYRSITENSDLKPEEKIMVRDHAHKFFRKSFDFLQLKDPVTYFKVSTLGQELTKADENQIWEEIRRNQQLILKDKRIKHRNFGTYSKHNCGHEWCVYNGLMIKEESMLAEAHMHFVGDKNKYAQKVKSIHIKSDRKKEKKIIDRDLESD